jgi:hypothetical protein
MTDEELLKVSDLLLSDPHGEGLRAMARLTPAERDRMRLLVKTKSDEAVRKRFAEMEAYGSMDRIRELYAQDLAKKEERKTARDAKKRLR